MNTPKQSIEELQQAIDQASAEMEAARQKLVTATRTLNIAQRSRHPDIQEARRVATCIAQAGQVILDLAAEVVRLREQAKADETAFHPGSGLPFLRMDGFQPTGRHCGDCTYRRAQEDGTSHCAVGVRAPVEKGMWACTAHV